MGWDFILYLGAYFAIMFVATHFFPKYFQFAQGLVMFSIVAAVFAMLFGLPGWLVLNAISDGHAPVWTVIPIGIASAALWFSLSKGSAK